MTFNDKYDTKIIKAKTTINTLRYLNETNSPDKNGRLQCSFLNIIIHMLKKKGIEIYLPLTYDQ